MSKTKIIVNLYGGPGTGKSTVAAQLFALSKIEGLDAEMVREYVKNWVWEGRKTLPGDQAYFFCQQARQERIFMLSGVDLVVCDSPLALCNFYGQKYDPAEKELNTTLPLLSDHLKLCSKWGYRVVHVFLNRKSRYNPAGRYEDEATAKAWDLEIIGHLERLGFDFHRIDADEGAADKILKIAARGGEKRNTPHSGGKQTKGDNLCKK